MLELIKGKFLLPILEISENKSRKTGLALFHFAYTFNSDDFHGDLKERIVHHGRINIEQLHQRARSLSLNASDELKQILSSLKYDDEWLNDPDGDNSHAYLWYLINLASVFKPCPSLGNNRFHGSHYVLEAILPIARWESDEIRALIFGKPLSTLLESSEYQIFLPHFTLHGGCLSNKDIVSIHAHLRLSTDYFSPQSSESRSAIKIYSDNNNMNPIEVLNCAYGDAVDMLETAMKSKESLYLLRDM